MENDFNDKVGDYQPTSPDEVKVLYDDFAKTYDETLVVWEYEAPTVAAALLKQHLPSGKKILDAGCGTGLTGEALVKVGFRQVVGIDLSPVSVDLAAKRGVYAAVETADLGQPLRFETDAFDGINCVGVLTYVPELQPTLREFVRITKPGGVLVFTQREDLYKKRDTLADIVALEKEGILQSVLLSDPKPYLPGHAEFKDKIGVHYCVCQII
ncbi:MAG: class I SAM-dependent methyltransferase [Chloroflexota bacterium]